MSKEVMGVMALADMTDDEVKAEALKAVPRTKVVDASRPDFRRSTITFYRADAAANPPNTLRARVVSAQGDVVGDLDAAAALEGVDVEALLARLFLAADEEASR